MGRFRWMAATGVLVALLVSACSKPADLDRPPAPVEESLPKEAPRSLPPAEAMRLTPALKVRTVEKGLTFTGRGPWYMLVAELGAGVPVTYLDSREGWLQIETPDGDRAWLVANDAAVTDGRELGGRYRIAVGGWELATPSGLEVAVSRRAPGVMRVTVSRGTSSTEPLEVAALSDLSLAVLTPAAGAFEGALNVGDGGLGRVSVSSHGVLIDLEKPALHQVITQSPERVELEFRPALERVEQLPDGWGFTLRGESRPVVRPEGDSLLIDLPAAVKLAEVPAGLVVEEVAAQVDAASQPLSSARATIPVRMPAGGLRLRLPLPNQPYALTQPEPGRYELRLLAPGLKGKRIVLDPGHGGEETGAVGRTGVPEKDLNLAVALRLKPMLEAAGAEVIMTRTTDRRVIDEALAAAQTSYAERTQVDLAARSALANQARADLVLSIHANGGPAGDGGIEVFWAVPNLNAALSRRLAELAQAELLQALSLADRGVKQRPFNVIRYSEAPAVLVELGFMTNPAEEALLLSEWGQQRSAEALLRAVQAYFEEAE